MLVDHANAGIESRARISRRKRLSEGLDASLVGDIVAEENVHQRRLAGTVLPEKCYDFAPLQLEGNGIVGPERTEALADAGKTKGRIA
ncbi:hypothetical protein D9M70_513380 [compost metagenome]